MHVVAARRLEPHGAEVEAAREVEDGDGLVGVRLQERLAPLVELLGAHRDVVVVPVVAGEQRRAEASSVDPVQDALGMNVAKDRVWRGGIAGTAPQRQDHGLLHRAQLNLDRSRSRVFSFFARRHCYQPARWPIHRIGKMREKRRSGIRDFDITHPYPLRTRVLGMPTVSKGIYLGIPATI